MSGTVSWNLRMSVREGQLDAARALMKEMVSATHEETGTLAYEWFLSEDGRTCHVYERYEDSSAVMVHVGTFQSRFVQRLLEIFEPVSLSVYGEPSEEVRASLDGFGAEYLGTFGGFSR